MQKLDKHTIKYKIWFNKRVLEKDLEVRIDKPHNTIHYFK